MRKVLIFGLVFLLFAAFASADLTPNLGMYWSFDNTNITGNNPIDLVNQQYNGTNDADTGQPGVLGQSFGYTATNSDDTSTVFDMSTQAVTVSLWVKDSLADGDDDDIVDNWAGADRNFILRSTSDSKITAYFYQGAARTVATTTTINADEWYHVVVTFNTTDNFGRLYINGALNNTVDVGGVRAASATPTLYLGSNDGSSGFFNGTLDEFAIWNSTLSAVQISTLYNSSNSCYYYYLDDDCAPAGVGANETILEVYNGTAVETINETLTLRFLNYNLTNLSTANVTYNGTFYPGTLTYYNSSYVEFNATITPPLVIANNTNLNFSWDYTIRRANGTNTTNSTSSKQQQISWGYYPTLFTIDDAIETETKVSYTDFVTESLATLNNFVTFNGANYSSISFNSSAFARNITFPTQTQTSKVYDYNSWLNVSYNGTTFLRNVTGNNTVYKVNITNCSAGASAIQFIISDEYYLQYLPSTTLDLELSVSAYNGNTSFDRNYTFTKTNDYNLTVCVFPVFANYLVDAYMIHSLADTFTHRYYLVNANVTNVTSTANLYNFNTTSGRNTLELTVVDEYYNPIPGVVVKLQRYYPGGGAATVHSNTSVDYSSSFVTVQMDTSDEFGQTIFHVNDAGAVDYKLIFEINNSVVRTTDTMKLLCTNPADCTATFQIDTSETTPIISLFTEYNWSYNNATEIVTVNWDDTTQLTDEISIYVTKETFSNVQTICSTTVNTPSGTFTCNTTGYDGLINVRAYRTASPLVQFLDVTIDKAMSTMNSVLELNGFTTEGNLWAALLGIAIVLSSAGSIIGVIIATIIALIVLALTGISSVVNLTFVTVAVIIGVIIAIRVRR